MFFYLKEKRDKEFDNLENRKRYCFFCIACIAAKTRGTTKIADVQLVFFLVLTLSFGFHLYCLRFTRRWGSAALQGDRYRWLGIYFARWNPGANRYTCCAAWIGLLDSFIKNPQRKPIDEFSGHFIGDRNYNLFKLVGGHFCSSFPASNNRFLVAWKMMSHWKQYLEDEDVSFCCWDSLFEIWN